MSIRRLFFILLVAAALLIATGIPIKSNPGPDDELVVGRNVNMVSGQEFGTGDPYLQRQNEPSIAVSTRNPMHLLAGANDYRTIDEPFEDEVPGYEYGSQAYGKDAWVGVFKSYDGGQSWITTLFPGFPQDTSDEGMYSPLKLFGTAADPVVRAGTNGTFYYAGIAFDRVDRGSGVVFVGRFIDLNNKENGDTIVYDGVSVVDQGNAGQFLDKPWLAVDIPQAGLQSQALFRGQSESIPCGNIYIAYSAFIGKTDKNVRSKMLFARSTDCGHTWSTPIKIDESSHIDQGAVIAIDPNNGTVYVAWRRFAHPSQPSAIIFAKSTDGGLTFTKPAVVKTLDLSFPPSQDGPFDQRTTELSFRTNSHPTMAVDNDHVVYLAWAERGADMTSRIVMTYSTDFGSSWVSPTPVDNTDIGHQFMPSLTFAGGKLMLTWYDQRKDISMNFPECNPLNPEFVEDNPCRHTIDVRVAQINPIYSSSMTSFSSSSSLGIAPSKQVSRYLHSYETDVNGDPVEDQEGYVNLIQYQYNFSGLPLFQKGTVPFMGDYIDIAPSPMFLPPSASSVSSSTSNSGWTYNTDSSQYTVYHITWADNRDVWIPVLEEDGITPDLWPENWWSNPYNAPGSGCTNETTAGILNQNVYTSCISPGFVAGSPGNTKPLDLEGATDSNEWPIPRAFTITVKNMTDLEKLYELNIEAPPGVLASFVQYFDIDPDAEFPSYPDGFPDYGPLLVAVSAHSTLSQPVFVYPATNPKASVRVHVEELDTALTSIVILNPDPTNPPIEDPDDYSGPNIKGYEVHDPNIKGTVVTNYTGENFLLNPNIKGTDLINSDTAAPNIKGPNIKGPNIKGNPLNPNIKGTDVPSPNIKGTSISEISWEIENEGNTTTPYTFDIYTDYEYPDPNTVPPEEAVQFLLLIYKVYTTPTAVGCELKEEEHHELIANIPNPNIKGPNIKGTPTTTMRAANNPAEDAKNATFYLKPRVIEQGGEKIREKVVVKLYAFDPVTGNGDDFDFGSTEEPNANAAVISRANNTEDLQNGNYLLPGDSSSLFIVNESLPDGEVLQTYTAFLTPYGYDKNDVLTWEIIGDGDLPDNLQLNPSTGEISGTPIEAGAFTFTVQVTATGINPTQIATKKLSLAITAPVGPPTLVSPSEGVELDNGCDFADNLIEWDFDWSDVSGATQYNLYVKHEGPPVLPLPIIDEYNIIDSSFDFDRDSHIIEDNRYNWKWKVRAKINDQYWTAWSAERSFDVEPLNTDCPGDITLPLVTSFNPTDEASDVALDADLVITFDENVVADTGDITIYRSNDSVFETMAVTDTGKVAIVDNVVTINPGGTFENGTGYYVQIAATCFKDTAGNHYVGINDKTTWNFSTIAIGDLIAYYPFNGNANDESGNGNHGTVYGDATFVDDRFGNSNGAINLDGIDDYVELLNENNFDLTELTIVTIFKIPDYSKRNYIISKGDNFGNFNLMINGPGDTPIGRAGYAKVIPGGNWSSKVTNDPVQLNNFIHIAVTLDSTYFKSYLNGQPEWTALNYQPTILNDQNVIIGGYTHSGIVDEYFLGVIDEIRIYNRVLSDTEIEALYSQSAPGIITTVVGDGTYGFSGDGGPATNAQLRRPWGIAFDSAGNLFIADTDNHCIRKVDANTGIITTVAGSGGSSGFSGDGGAATQARLDDPSSVTLDSNDNLYIADSSNDRIRMVDAVTGIITTVVDVDADLASPSDIAVDAAGNMYIADTINHLIKRKDAVTSDITIVVGDGSAGYDSEPYPGGEEGGPAIEASLYEPTGVALDSQGNLYISSFYDCTILKVNLTTGIITTAVGIVGNSWAGFGCGYGGDGEPAVVTRGESGVYERLDESVGVIVDSAGNLYVADTGNHRIRRVDGASGIINTVAGNGTATFSGDGGLSTIASLNFPSRVALDSQGNLYIVDTDNNRIRKVIKNW